MTRIKVKGHYRSVERDEKGRFKSVKKWTSKLCRDKPISLEEALRQFDIKLGEEH